SAGTSFDVCAVAVPHDDSPSSIQAVQQEAADAEAYYRQFQQAPTGFALLGESGGGGAAAPPRTRPGKGRGQPSEAAALLFQLPSPGQSLTPSTARSGSPTPTLPVDQAGPTRDRFRGLGTVHHSGTGYRDLGPAGQHGFHANPVP